MDKATLKLIAKEAEQALQAVAAKYNMTVKFNGGKYDSVMYSPKVQFTLKEVNGKSPAQAQFETYAKVFNLLPEDFGKTVSLLGTQYKIIGLELSRRKFPVLVEDVSGNKRLWEVRVIRNALGHKFDWEK